MYEAEFAQLYDLIHRHRGKDYAAEAADLAHLVRDRHPGATSVLDVASGTGGHLRFLRELFPLAAGLEVSPEMLAIARERVPDVRMYQGDMRDFDLGRTFDAITVMFSSIGYVESKAELDRTLSCLAKHLATGGVLIIEPWVFPETFAPGYVAADLARDNGRTVARVSHSERDGDVVRMTVHYITADATGARHLTDTHRLALFTRGQYEDAFSRAGCTAEFIEPERFSRGLFVGIKG
nr:Arm34 [uncultured bacterium]